MRNVMRAVALAILVAIGGSVIVQNTPVPDQCKTLTPDNWFLYWWYGCDKDSSGGGGSGAGMD